LSSVFNGAILELWKQETTGYMERAAVAECPR
jgi:hypothetical protein